MWLRPSEKCSILPTASDMRAAKPYDGMNGVAANMLLHLTSSTRFGGPLNMDLREIRCAWCGSLRAQVLVWGIKGSGANGVGAWREGAGACWQSH